MSNILDDIVEKTREDLKKRKQEISLTDLHSLEGFEKERLSFKEALQSSDWVSIIAEVKKASPSKGIIRKDFKPIDLAKSYEDGGASAISVLTDVPFFQGSLQYLADISKSVSVPVLRKDFIVDPYQVKEARAYGADAILLIATITQGQQMDELLHAAKEFGLDALVECYDTTDFNSLDLEQVDILGVNNRDLKKFEVDVHRGTALLKQAPEGTVLVSESGLSSGSDIALLQKEGIHAALIGEYFMRQEDPGKGVQRLLKESKESFERAQAHDE